jgi:hypothetical protein
VEPRYADYLPEGGRGDLADQIENSIFDDPEPTIWISPADHDAPAGPWQGSCQFDEEAEDFYGTRDEVIEWARRTPATCRYLREAGEDVLLTPEPGDAPPPPPGGPTVQVQGPDAEGRWVAVWFHRGQVEQFWGTRQQVIAWAAERPAGRRRISVDSGPWRPIEE